MHTITLTLDGVITDTVTVSLEDAVAFPTFMELKQRLTAGGVPAKRRGRRPAAVTGIDQTPETLTDATAESGD